MPQMAPLWWEILFLLFIMSFILMSVMTYFCYNIKIKSNAESKMSIKQLNWMW